MIFLSTVLACLLIGSGLSAVFLGSGMIVLERGWSMVISGSVVATGGVLLLGMAMVIRELQRLPDRLGDVLPEALPSHLLYASDEAGLPAPEPADAHAARRPRIEPGEAEATPESAEDEAGWTPAAPRREQPQRDASPSPQPDIAPSLTADDKPETESSALKIQISLHGNPAHAQPPQRPGIRPPAPIAITEDRDLSDDSETGRQPRSFWSRLGRTDKAALPVIASLATEDDTPPLPPGPTAAERARERLALADTPEERNTEQQQTRSPASAVTAEAKVAETNKEAASTKVEKAEAIANKPAPSPEAKGHADERPAASQAVSPVAAASEKPAPADKPVAPAADDKNTPAVVGSYRAGSNVFVMFDNGAIEAETPQGIFRFPSLDKLKAYIASGEDPAIAGTPVDRPPSAAPTDAPASGASDNDRKATG